MTECSLRKTWVQGAPVTHNQGLWRFLLGPVRQVGSKAKTSTPEAQGVRLSSPRKIFRSLLQQMLLYQLLSLLCRHVQNPR